MSTFISRRSYALLLATPLALAHCGGGSTTWTDPDNAAAAAELDLTLPMDATGHVAENPVGQPVSVLVTMIQTGPGTCHEEDPLLGCGTVGDSSSNCTVCSGPDTPLDFHLTAVACDDDLCDVAGIQRGAPATGDTVTIVPKAGIVTLRATAASGSLVANGVVLVGADCASTPNAPACQ